MVLLYLPFAAPHIIIWKQQLQQSLVEEGVGFDHHGSTVITFSQLLISIITIWRQQLQQFLVGEGGGVGSPQFHCNYLLQLLVRDEQNIFIISVFPAFPDMFQPWTIDSWKKCQQCILNEEKHLSCVKCVQVRQLKIKRNREKDPNHGLAVCIARYLQHNGIFETIQFLLNYLLYYLVTVIVIQKLTFSAIKSAGGRLQLNTHTPYVYGFAWSDMEHGCMVYTGLAPRRLQLHVAPAMPTLKVHHLGGYSKNAL